MSITYLLMKGRYLTKEDIDEMYEKSMKIDFFRKPTLLERIKWIMNLG